MILNPVDTVTGIPADRCRARSPWARRRPGGKATSGRVRKPAGRWRAQGWRTSGPTLIELAETFESLAAWIIPMSGVSGGHLTDQGQKPTSQPHCQSSQHQLPGAGSERVGSGVQWPALNNQQSEAAKCGGPSLERRGDRVPACQAKRTWSAPNRPDKLLVFVAVELVQTFHSRKYDELKLGCKRLFAFPQIPSSEFLLRNYSPKTWTPMGWDLNTIAPLLSM